MALLRRLAGLAPPGADGLTERPSRLRAAADDLDTAGWLPADPTARPPVDPTTAAEVIEP